MTQNALVGSMGGRAQSLLGYLRSLPISVWRNTVFVLAAIWIVRNSAAMFWLVFPAPEVPAPTKLATPIEVGSKVATSSVGYESIEGLKHIFGNPDEVVVTKPVATATPPPQSEEEIAKTTKLRLKLHGVFASSDPRKGSAIIADGKDQALYAVGEEIKGKRGVKLDSVMQKRVVLDNKGTKESLWLFSEEDFKVSARKSTSKKKEEKPASNNVPPSRAVKTTARPDQIPKNIGDVVRFSVHREGGKMVGYRIRPGRDRELFNQVGLKANDIVTSVNGIEVNDPKQIRSVYKSMKTATEAQLTVLRDGITHSITISLDSGA